MFSVPPREQMPEDAAAIAMLEAKLLHKHPAGFPARAYTPLPWFPAVSF